MAIAIMGSSAAVAGQPKSDLDARACFCKSVSQTTSP